MSADEIPEGKLKGQGFDLRERGHARFRGDDDAAHIGLQREQVEIEAGRFEPNALLRHRLLQLMECHALRGRGMEQRDAAQHEPSNRQPGDANIFEPQRRYLLALRKERTLAASGDFGSRRRKLLKAPTILSGRFVLLYARPA